ncbi:MAG: SDR family oxidoreductase [Pirellulaceae bacterium]
MDFLKLAGKEVLIMGVANRKSVAYHVGKTLTECSANVIYAVRSQDRADSCQKLLGDAPIYVCDVEHQDQIDQLASQIQHHHGPLAGCLHSIAFADYSGGMKPFHETGRAQFLRTMDVSCFSFVAVANALKDCFAKDASMVTVSISTTKMANQNYGFMAPVKAALDSSLAFLAKSFSEFSEVRFNAVAPGLLKTSASAGIPGYVDAYLFAEQAIPRKRAVQTQEAADVAAFLLSPRSSGVNAQTVVVDAGMAINYFDDVIVKRVVEGSGG